MPTDAPLSEDAQESPKVLRKQMLEYRSVIDRVDQALIGLLGERIAAAKAIGVVKRELNEEVVRPERERDLRNKHAQWAGSQQVPPALVTQIYDVILAHSRALQEQPSGAASPLSPSNSESDATK